MRRGWCNKHYHRWQKHGDPLWCPDPPADLPGEGWLPIVGYENLYEVSDLGRLRSLPRNGGNGRSYGGVILQQQSAGGTRYLTVQLSKDNVAVGRMVHELVPGGVRWAAPRGHGMPSRAEREV